MRGQDGEVGAVHDLVSQRLSEQLVCPCGALRHSAPRHRLDSWASSNQSAKFRKVRRPTSGLWNRRDPSALCKAHPQHRPPFVRNFQENQGHPVQRHPYFRPGAETNMLGYERYVMLLDADLRRVRRCDRRRGLPPYAA